MLRWMQNVYFEAPSFFQDQMDDIKGKEFAIALPLVALFSGLEFILSQF